MGTTTVSLILIACIGLFMIGCQSTVDPLEEDLNKKEYFQKAIEASDSRNYKLALRYYEVFKEKFPDDRDGNLWAAYEIAFLHHKLGDDDMAVELFDQLLARYETEQGLPPAPRILAERVKSNIINKEDGAEPDGAAGADGF